MPIAVLLPALSPTMKEGKIIRWLKKEGDKVSSGMALAECETDKSNLEIEAYDDGVLLKILVKEGDLAEVGAPIAYIGQPGEKVDVPPPAAAAKPANAPAAPAPKAPGFTPLPAAPAPAPVGAATGNERIKASPLAKKMAADKGLELSALNGSGPSGRIIKRDVEEAAAKGPSGAAKAPMFTRSAPGVRAAPQVVPLSQMRKVIAQRMTEVKPGVPHFYLNIEVEMEAALKLREEAKAQETKISVNDVLIKAAAVALKRYPRINQSFNGDHALQLSTADIGVAVALEDGLITPVVRDADIKGLAEISAEVRELADRAKRRALRPEEYTGGSIAISNLGMYGIDSFIAVINPPHSAILAVGRVEPKAVVRDGQVVPRQMMTVTLSGDHRVIDGAIGALYLQELKALLEHPLRLLF